MILPPPQSDPLLPAYQSGQVPQHLVQQATAALPPAVRQLAQGVPPTQAEVADTEAPAVDPAAPEAVSPNLADAGGAEVSAAPGVDEAVAPPAADEADRAAEAESEAAAPSISVEENLSSTRPLIEPVVVRGRGLPRPTRRNLK